MPALTASDLLDAPGTMLSPDDDMHSAMRSLLDKKLSGAAVVDEENRLVGILSEKDCLKVVATAAFERLPEGKVSDYMTIDVVTLGPRSTIYEIVGRFLGCPYRRIPVVDADNVFLGVVSRSSVVRTVAEMREDPSLFHTPDAEPLAGEGAGVDSAMRRARGR
jgi:CBS domain-containing protein